jgi:hypothetical protein
VRSSFRVLQGAGRYSIRKETDHPVFCHAERQRRISSAPCQDPSLRSERRLTGFLVASATKYLPRQVQAPAIADIPHCALRSARGRTQNVRLVPWRQLASGPGRRPWL